MAANIPIPRSSILTWKSRPHSAGNAVEFLENNGLADASVVEDEIRKWPTPKLEAVAEDLYDFLWRTLKAREADDPLALSPFVSLASASLRGDAGCCRPACRSARLAVLARYAAMYADSVFVPVALSRPPAGGSAERLREEVCRTAFSILELRPLVEEGIVLPVLPHMQYCSECARLELRRFGGGVEAARAQARQHLGDFEFTCVLLSNSPRIAALVMEGPADYLDHGSKIRVYGGRSPKWFPRTLGANGRYRVPKATVRKAGLVEQIFGEIAADVCFHQAFQSAINAAYLSDLPGEAEFLRILSAKDELAVRTEQVCAQLTHEIPMLTDLPVRAVIRIRDESRESFELYRSTVRKLVSDYVQKNRSTTTQEAREIYRDVLEPTLAQLRVEAKRQRRIWARKSTLTAGFAIGVVSLCATGALQSSQALALLGGATASGLLSQLAEPPRSQPVTSSNLYFLLRLQEEGKRRASGAE